jgi:hypothetical protein
LSASIVGPWLEDGNNTCATNATDPWVAIPQTASKVAHTVSSGQTGRLDLVWGFRAGTTQAADSYRATVLVEALAPDF